MANRKTESETVVKASARKRKRRIGEIVRRCAGAFLMIAGLCFYLSPMVEEALLAYHTFTVIRDFQDRFGRSDTDSTAESEENETEEETVYAVQNSAGAVTEDEKDALYQACFAYNCRVYAASQSGLKDVESYEKFDLGEEALNLLEDGLFGYIEIPAMDVILPLYLGSSTEHMAAGAAVLGETSAPIGGLNTNAVISGHRGYRGSPYFREIEKLEIGDVVYVTNPWETLTYTVSEIDIISPQDAEAVKIQEGRDMITLLTCHPYRSGGKYRYVVYCDRADSESSDDTFSEGDENCSVKEEGDVSGDSGVQTAPEIGAGMESTIQTELITGENFDISAQNGAGEAEYIVASDGTIYTSSAKDIETEQLLRLGSGIFLAGCFILLCFRRNIKENSHINKAAAYDLSKKDCQ